MTSQGPSIVTSPEKICPAFYGDTAADPPIQRPLEVELVVHLATAKEPHELGKGRVYPMSGATSMPPSEAAASTAHRPLAMRTRCSQTNLSASG